MKSIKNFWNIIAIIAIATPLFLRADPPENSSGNPFEKFPPSKKGNVMIASPIIDSTFKEIFGKKDLLMDFLNSLLYPNADENGLKIRELVYRPSAIVTGREFKKIFIDIGCTCSVYSVNSFGKKITQGEYKFDIEMQKQALDNYYVRSIFYGAKLFTNDVKPSLGYSEVVPVKVISLIKTDQIGLSDKVCYRVVPTIVESETPQGPHTFKIPKNDTMEWYYIQLGKNDKLANENPALYEWLSFLNIEAEQTPLSQESYAYEISPNRFKNEKIRIAIKMMHDYVENNFANYKREIAEEIDAIRNTRDAQKNYERLTMEAEEANTRAEEANMRAEEANMRADAANARVEEAEEKIKELKRKLESLLQQKGEKIEEESEEPNSKKLKQN